MLVTERQFPLALDISINNLWRPLMSNEIIYSHLLSKSDKIHHIVRYIKFVQSFKHQTKQKGLTEYHHILPKCKGLFPEYKSLYQHPWNGVHLTQRQHFIAHWMLHKIFGDSQTRAFWLMCKGRKIVTSKVYESVKKEMSISLSEINKGNKWGFSKGIKRTEQQNKYKSECQKKVTEFISPDGTIYIHKGFADFCKLHKLNMPCMRRVVLGQRPHHKGWKCRYITNEYPEFAPYDPIKRAKNSAEGHKKVFYYKSPDGTIGTYKGITDFSNEYKICQASISTMLKNGTGSVKGWICRYEPITSDDT